MNLLTIICALCITISGPARVIDGDTLKIGDTKVRLNGIDAAELNTDLGQIARDALIEIIDGRPLTCALTGRKTWDRQVGYCVTPDGQDIAEKLISDGFALACPRYDRRYVRFEQPQALAEQPRASYCVLRPRR
jgi:endonuclease YncB( thermonuclease family)